MARFARLAAAVVTAGLALASAPVGTAATQFITVTLPPNADLTTYGWCDGFGCQDPLRINTPNPAAVYDAISAISALDGRRLAGLDAYALGSWATTRAVRTLQTTAPAGGPTTVAAVLLRSPTRPNGGLFARFDAGSATPPSNFNAFGGGAGPGTELDVSFVDVGREYDGFVDAPSWTNPFSMLNAMAGALFLADYADTVTWQDPRCPNGTCVAPATWPVTLPASTGPVYAVARVPDPANPGQTIDVTSPDPIGVAVIPAPDAEDQSVYYTQYTEHLPLLAPLQLPFDVVNRVVAEASGGRVRPQLVNPAVQVLEPALRILVNLGYPDVDPSAGYTRTLTRPGERIPFGTLPDLTPAEWAAVPGAVGDALAEGVRDAIEHPFGVGRPSAVARQPEVADAPEPVSTPTDPPAKASADDPPKHDAAKKTRDKPKPAALRDRIQSKVDALRERIQPKPDKPQDTKGDEREPEPDRSAPSDDGEAA